MLVVSVPSSSGQRLRPMCPPRSSTDRTTVSVPSSSGQRLRLLWARDAAARVLRFQSPLLRGNGFDLGQPNHRRAERRCFSPLFFGATASTMQTKSAGTNRHGFQSPLLRGNGFDAWSSAGAAISRSTFQSPLLRGNGFDDGPAPRAAAGLFCFSPLFFGATASTRIDAEGFDWREKRFSPLFFGATASTAGICDACGQGLVFQSPLLRGNGFDETRRPKARRPFRVMFQSPLLRGNGFDPKRYGYGRRRMR